MFTISRFSISRFSIPKRNALWAAAGVALATLAGCASRPHAEGNQLAYRGGPLNLGVAATQADLAGDFSYPADGRSLPAGSGTFEQGAQVYQQQCLACHGDHLQGGLGDRLIGGRGTLSGNAPVKTVESYWPYATTLFDYVKRAMPFTAPGSLTDDQVYAVTAYVLAEANVIARSETMNAQTLPRVKMPNRNGFFSPDPRPDAP